MNSTCQCCLALTCLARVLILPGVSAVIAVLAVSNVVSATTLLTTIKSTTATNTPSICSVTTYPAVPAATAACTSITLNGINVPGNSTLDLSKLLANTVVTFKGLTTFGYANADYNLIEVGGTNVTILGAPGAVIDGNGQSWWDGQGSNGGLIK